MNILVKIISLLIVSVSMTFAQESKGQDIIVNISNFKSNTGKVHVALFNSESTFLDEGFKGVVADIKDNTCTVTFKNIPKGTYAISLFHDENSNGKMDSNFLGIPKEDYGCSNNAKGFMGPPKWEDAKFEVKQSTIQQTIKL